MSENVITAIISTAGGILIAYIVNVLGKKVKTKPVDRVEAMFDGYERLIHQKDIEDQRKAALLDELEAELAAARCMVKKLEEALAMTQKELERSRQENMDLKETLTKMRKEYLGAV